MYRVQAIHSEDRGGTLGCQFGRALPVSPSNGCSWGDVLVRVPRSLHRRAHKLGRNAFANRRERSVQSGSHRKGLGIASFMYIRAKVAQGATLDPLYCFLLPFHLHGSLRDCGTRKPQLLFHRPPFCIFIPRRVVFPAGARSHTEGNRPHRFTDTRPRHCGVNTAQNCTRCVTRLCDWGSREASY